MITDPVLSAREPLGVVQSEVVPALRATLDVPVLDHVNEDQDPPYVVFGRGWTAERDTLSGTAVRLWFQIDVWSLYRGWKEADRIADRITQRLSHARIDTEGWAQIHILREQALELRDPDGKHRHIAMTFNCPYVSTSGG